MIYEWCVVIVGWVAFLLYVYYTLPYMYRFWITNYGYDQAIVKVRDSPFNDLKIAYKIHDGYCKADDILKLHTSDTKRTIIAIQYDDPNLASHTSRYALGYVLAEGSKRIDQQFLGKLKGKHYERHDIPRITTMLGSICENTKRQFSSKFYKKAYDNNKPSTNESTTDAGPFVVIYDGEKAHCFRPLEKIKKFIVEKAKVTKNNPKNGVQNRGNSGGTK